MEKRPTILIDGPKQTLEGGECLPTESAFKIFA